MPPELPVLPPAPRAAPAVGVPVRSGGRLYALFFCGTAAAAFAVGLGGVSALRGGYPGTEAASREAAAVGLRAVSALVYSLSSAVAQAALYAYVHEMGVREAGRLAAAIALGLSLFNMSLAWHWRPSDHSLDAAPGSGPLITVGSLALLVVYLLPLWMVRGVAKRGPCAPARAMPFAYVAIAGMVVVTHILLGWSVEVPAVAGIGFAVIASAVAMWIDRPDATALSSWYIAAIGMAAGILPATTWLLVNSLIDRLDQSDGAQSLASAAALSGFLLVFWRIFRAFAQRGLPARHWTVALAPVMVFEDVWAEFFFVGSGAYTGGFFALLCAQAVRTLVRDTGLASEALRAAQNAVRRARAQPPVARTADDVVAHVRVWLQNAVSEASAMLLVIGVLAGEDAQGDAVGTLSGLGHEARVSLLGAYGVVAVTVAVVHGVCYALLRRWIAAERARPGTSDAEVSIGDQSTMLVRDGAVYLAATQLFVVTSALSFVRLLRVDKEWAGAGV